MEAMRPYGGYLYLLATIALSVYGQIILKWQIGRLGGAGGTTAEKIDFLVRMLLTPWVLTCFFAGFLAALCWIMTLARLPLSVAYPFLSLGFAIVIAIGAVFFHEPLSTKQLVGSALLVVALGLIAQR